MNIILTGVTGILGSHILYEMLLLYTQGKWHGKVFVICRSFKKNTCQQRIEKLLSNVYIPDYLKNFSLAQLLSYIEIIDSDLQDLNESKIREKVTGKCYLIHTAASTDLTNTERTQEELYKTNYLATLKLLELTQKFIHKFIFVSTAYSCGVQQGTVDDNFLNLLRTEYRNPYEKLKAKTENEFVVECKKRNIPWQIVRPSIICGRLLEEPLFFTPKFNVFYSYVNFFYRIMFSRMKNMPIRICINPDAQLNMVPVDSVAKIIVESLLSDIKELNVVGQDINIRWLTLQLMELMGYEKFEFTDIIPQEKENLLEDLYYDKIHAVFGSYMNSPKLSYLPHTFIRAKSNQFNIKQQLTGLYNFAKMRKFRDYT